MEKCFSVRELLGLLAVKQRLSDVSEDKRLAIVDRCYEYTSKTRDRPDSVRWTPQATDVNFSGKDTLVKKHRAVDSERKSSSNRVDDGLLLNNMLSCIDLMSSMVEIKNDNWISSYSTLAGRDVELIINKVDVTLVEKNARGSGNLLCQHRIAWMGIMRCLGSGGELVYIGHEVTAGQRIAVVLDLGREEVARQLVCLCEQAKEELKQGIAKAPTAVDNVWHEKNHLEEEEEEEDFSTEHIYENDAFYMNFGFAVEDQEKLYETSVAPKPPPKREDQKKLEVHVKKFIEDEVSYNFKLGKLIHSINSFQSPQLNHTLRHLDTLKKVHENMNLKGLVNSKTLSAEKVADTIIRNAEYLQSYIDYIRETPAIENSIKKCFKNDREMTECLLSTRKRMHNYFMHLETWLKFTTNKTVIGKVNEAVHLLKEIYKAADSSLLIDAVKKSPSNLNLHCPLIKQGVFTVQGKDFQKKEPYRLLLFQELLVFTKPSTGILLCHEALRFEQIVLMNRGQQRLGDKGIGGGAIKIEVNHGERRGKEIIQVYGKSDGIAKEWEDEIMKILADLAKRIKQTYRFKRT